MAEKYPENTDSAVHNLSTIWPDQLPIFDFIDNLTTFESCLGYGRFGVVLKVKISSKFYAVKFLLSNEILTEEKARREYDIPLALKPHKNVVGIHNYVKNKVLSPSQVEQIIALSDPTIEASYKIELRKRATVRWTCIQMELCGPSLRDWLKEFKPPKDSIYTQMKQAAIVQDLIEGMEFLHKNGVIHRDLKPENIMFTSFEYNLPIKIGDFGLARLILPEDGSTLTSNVGTRWYRAPEILDGKYSYQADIYSLGLVLWETTALIPSKKLPGLIDQLVNDKNEKLVDEHPLLGPGLRELIISCTKRYTIDRLKSMTEASKLLNIKVIQIRPQEIVARTSEALRLCLKFVSRGCTIRLVETTYHCGIYMRVDNTKIFGQGENTVIDLRANEIQICASHCTLSYLKIIGHARDDLPTIWVENSHNKINDVTIKLEAYHKDDGTEEESNVYGIFVEGENHMLQRVTIENTTPRDLLIYGSLFAPNLTIWDLFVTKGQVVICIDGESGSLKRIGQSDLLDNSLQNVSLRPESQNELFDRRDCPAELHICVKGLNCNLEEIQCAGVFVNASNTSLHNVQCSGVITILAQLNNIALKKCETKSLNTESKVSIIDCKLGAVSNIIEWKGFYMAGFWYHYLNKHLNYPTGIKR